MSETERIDPIENDADDEDVIAMLRVVEANQITYTTRAEEIQTLRDFRNKAFDISKPTGNNWMSSLQPIQVVDDVLGKLQAPALSYWCDSLNPLVVQVIRDGINTVKELGGFNSVLIEKPSQYRDAISYGDGFCRIGINTGPGFKITYDNIAPDKIYVDSNATIMHSRNGLRSVTRLVAIYSYDIDQAEALYPDASFGRGKIPTSRQFAKDFNKTAEQEAQSKERDVEFAHYFDIGGKEPIYMVSAGSNIKVVFKFKGKDYPFRDKNGKVKIPIGHLRGSFDSDEGFFNKGLLHVLYRYMVARQRVFNKQFGQSIRAMTDISVLNTGKMKSGTALKRIRDAKKMAKQGEQAIIVNDSGEEMIVTKLEAQQFETSLEALDTKFDKELKRMKINLDAIREQISTTATQILSENEAENEASQIFMNRNTDFFKFIDDITMDLVRTHIEEDDKTPVKTNVRIPKILRDANGKEILSFHGELQIEKDKNGKPMDEELTGVTLGDIRKLLDKYTVQTEVDTKSGVRQRDSIGTAKAFLGLKTAPNPAVATEMSKKIAEFNGIDIDPALYNTQQQGQPNQGAKGPSLAGIDSASKMFDDTLL